MKFTNLVSDIQGALVIKLINDLSKRACMYIYYSHLSFGKLATVNYTRRLQYYIVEHQLE